MTCSIPKSDISEFMRQKGSRKNRWLSIGNTDLTVFFYFLYLSSSVPIAQNRLRFEF